MNTTKRDEQLIQREYGQEKWPAILTSIRHRIAEGERDLGRVLWSVMRSWHGRAPLEESTCVLAGAELVLPFTLGWEARQGLVPEVLAARVEDDTSLVVELGSGWGFNLLQAWCRGAGPRDARYVAAEYTEAGRECSATLAALTPEMRFSAVAFDYNRAMETKIEPTEGHALVFSCQSIEQIPRLQPEVIEFIASLGRRVTCVHFEPCGWQTVDAEHPSAASHRDYAARCDYNRNLWPLLCAQEAEGVIELGRCLPDLSGPNPQNPVSIFEWRSVV